MDRPFQVIHANNMPTQAPICGETLSAPYDSPDTKFLYVYAELDRDLVKKCLDSTPFDYLTNVGVFYMADYSRVTSSDAPVYDSALMIPVSYKDETGGAYFFEFEDGSASVGSGREGWGHPKLQADKIVMNDYDGLAMGSVYVNGQMLYHIELDLENDDDCIIPNVNLEPNLLNIRHPRPDGPGLYCDLVLERYVEEDTKTKLYKRCNVTAFDINSIPQKHHPWGMFTPKKILGGEYMICDYIGSERTAPVIVERIK